MQDCAAESLLRMVNVTKRYVAPFSAPGAPEIEVLRDISLEILSGELLALTGPSGTGKSTLLHLMGTLDQPSEGDIFLRGQKLAGLNEASLADLRAREVGFVFQNHYLLPQCTVIENALVPSLALQGRENPEPPTERAKRLLTRVGLGDRLYHVPGQLSGGERQRVAVVRALINRPALLLADEPTGALDEKSATRLADLLVELNREENVTLVIATHSPDLAGRMARCYRLRLGRLTLQSP